MTGFQYLDGSRERIYSLSSGGEFFSIYSINDENIAFFSLGSAEKPLKTVKIPNPNVQVCVIKAVDSLQNPGISITGGENRLTFTNEQLIPDQAGSWASIVWIALPLKTDTGKRNDYAITISGTTPPFAVTASVNISIDRGIRMKSSPVKKEILK